MPERTNDYLRTILDAIPATLFVVDEDLRVHDFNDAAREEYGLLPSAVLNHRGGEVWHCLHATDVPEGCGRGPECKTCLIRKSVTDALGAGRVTRRRSRVTLAHGGERREIDLLISASPVPRADGKLALLALEDISELATLRDLVALCPRCRRVRDDQGEWRAMESYFRERAGTSFFHGLCPDCRREIPDGEVTR